MPLYPIHCVVFVASGSRGVLGQSEATKRREQEPVWTQQTTIGGIFG